MAGDDDTGFIDEDWVGEAERADRGDDLRDLALRMGPGVPRVGAEFAGRSVGDGQAIGGNDFVHQLCRGAANSSAYGRRNVNIQDVVVGAGLRHDMERWCRRARVCSGSPR